MTPDELAAIHARAMVVPPPWSAKTFEDFLAAPGAVLATTNAGFALGRVILDEVELLTLAVDPGARRQGQARLCLRRFEQDAWASGANRAFLEVAATNDAAFALYRSAGYTVDGSRRGYYARPGEGAVDAFVMSKTLSRL